MSPHESGFVPDGLTIESRRARGEPMTWDARIPLLGVTTTFRSNALAVAGVVEGTYGVWRSLAGHPGVVTPSDAEVWIIVEGRGPGRAPTPPEPDPVRHRAPETGRLLVAGRGLVGIADAVRGDAVAYVDAEWLSRGEEFVERILDPLTLTLLGSLDRQPLHAAAIGRGGIAVVLAGSSGFGKSTLSYAALRRGYTVLSDEVVYVQRHPRVRIWARRARIRLRPEASVHFPELRDQVPTPTWDERSKIRVPVPADAIQRYSEGAVLCVLAPARGPAARVEPISVDTAVRELTDHLDEGFDLYADGIGECIAAIAASGAWRLHVGTKPNDAVALIDELVRGATSGANVP